MVGSVLTLVFLGAVILAVIAFMLSILKDLKRIKNQPGHGWLAVTGWGMIVTFGIFTLGMGVLFFMDLYLLLAKPH